MDFQHKKGFLIVSMEQYVHYIYLWNLTTYDHGPHMVEANYKKVLELAADIKALEEEHEFYTKG